MTKNLAYLKYGNGPVIILLHGLFGALSNFEKVIEYFEKNYTIIFPLMPLYSSSLINSTVSGMVDFISTIVEENNLKDFHIVGNSLGGHVGLVYTLKNKDKVASITLTGSSGLFENSLGGGYPNRENYDFIKEKTELTFYKPETASKDLIDEVYETVNDRAKAIRIVTLAKSAVRHNLRTELPKIDIPVNLIWGKNDIITPLFVAEEFEKLIPNSTLNVIDECGHAPMMEHSDQFNKILEQFLNNIIKKG